MPKWWVLVGRAFRCLPLNQIVTIFLYSHQLVNYKFMHIYRYIFTMCLPVCETSTTGPGHQTWSGWGEKDRDRTKSGGFRGRSKGEDKSKLMRQNMEWLPANSGSLYGNFHIWCYLVSVYWGVCFGGIQVYRLANAEIAHGEVVDPHLHHWLFASRKRNGAWVTTVAGSPPLSNHHNLGSPVELGDAK